MSTIWVGSWSSKCGNCGKQVLPHEKNHEKVSGYGPEEPGCGTRFTHITSEYVGVPGIDKIVAEMRPDLTLIPVED